MYFEEFPLHIKGSCSSGMYKIVFWVISTTIQRFWFERHVFSRVFLKVPLTDLWDFYRIELASHFKDILLQDHFLNLFHCISKVLVRVAQFFKGVFTIQVTDVQNFCKTVLALHFLHISEGLVEVIGVFKSGLRVLETDQQCFCRIILWNTTAHFYNIKETFVEVIQSLNYFYGFDDRLRWFLHYYQEKH